MKKSPRTMKPLRQRPLPFREMNGQVDLWNGLTERHQQECRQALRRILTAVARHTRNIIRDDREFLAQISEQPIHE
jgi:hypothetical protein